MKMNKTKFLAAIVVLAMVFTAIGMIQTADSSDADVTRDTELGTFTINGKEWKLLGENSLKYTQVNGSMSTSLEGYVTNDSPNYYPSGSEIVDYAAYGEIQLVLPSKDSNGWALDVGEGVSKIVFTHASGLVPIFAKHLNANQGVDPAKTVMTSTFVDLSKFTQADHALGILVPQDAGQTSVVITVALYNGDTQVGSTATITIDVSKVSTRITLPANNINDGLGETSGTGSGKWSWTYNSTTLALNGINSRTSFYNAGAMNVTVSGTSNTLTSYINDPAVNSNAKPGEDTGVIQSVNNCVISPATDGASLIINQNGSFADGIHVSAGSIVVGDSSSEQKSLSLSVSAGAKGVYSSNGITFHKANVQAIGDERGISPYGAITLNNSNVVSNVTPTGTGSNSTTINDKVGIKLRGTLTLDNTSKLTTMGLKLETYNSVSSTIVNSGIVYVKGGYTPKETEIAGLTSADTLLTAYMSASEPTVAGKIYLSSDAATSGKIIVVDADGAQHVTTEAALAAAVNVEGTVVMDADITITGSVTQASTSTLIIPAGVTLTVSDSFTNSGTITNNGTIDIKNTIANKAQLVQAGGSITSTATNGGSIIVNAAWSSGGYDKRAIVVKAGTFEKQNVTAKNNGDKSAFMTVTATTAAVTVQNNVFAMERPNGIGVDNIGSNMAVSFIGNKFVSDVTDEASWVESCIFIQGTINTGSTITISGTDISGVKKFAYERVVEGNNNRGYAALVFYNNNGFTVGGLTSTDVFVKTDMSSIGIKRGGTTVQVKGDLSVDYLSTSDKVDTTYYGALTIAANTILTVTGKLDNYGTIANSGTLNAEGAIYLNSKGSATTADEGKYVITDKGSLTIGTDKWIGSEGKIVLSTGASATLSANTISGFDVTLKGNSTLNGIVALGNSAGTIGDALIVDSSATLTVSSGKAIGVYSASSFTNKGTVINNGMIYSSGSLSNVSGATLNNAGIVAFDSGSVVNAGIINNTGTLAFSIGMSPADPGKGDNVGIITSGANAIVGWYNGEPTVVEPTYYIKTTDSSGSFKMTGIYSGNTLTGIKTEFTAGSIEVNVDNNTNDVWTIGSDVIVTVPSGKTVTINNKLTNDGTINVQGTLSDTYTTTASGQMIVNTKGSINVTATGTLKVGLYNGDVNIDGEIDIIEGGKFLNFNTLVSDTGSPIILMESGSVVSINAKEVGGAVAYVLYGKATIAEKTATTGFHFKSGDSITVNQGAVLTLADVLTIPDGMIVNVDGTIATTSNYGIMISGSSSMKVGSAGKIIGGGIVNFRDSSSNSIVISAAQGATLTVTLDGSTVTGSGQEAKTSYSAIKVENIVAGAEGLTVTKGSVVIKGYYTTDDTGKITIPAKDPENNPNFVYISGSVDSGVVIDVAAEATLEVATGSSLTFEADSALVGKVTIADGSGAEIVYEEGSVVNGAVIEVTTREKEGGVIEVTVIVTLRTENGDKLMLYYEGEYCEVIFIEAFQGDKFVDILANVGVEPVKSRVSFDGWYNVLNEKVTSGMEVGSVAPTLTAKFTETPREGVTPHTPSIEPTVITVDETSGYDNTTMLVAAVVMLVVAIFVLGFVVLKKRN